MKKYLTLLFLSLSFLLASTVYAQDVGYLIRADCGTLSPVAFQTVCEQSTTTGGRVAGTIYVWNGSNWIGASGGSGTPVGNDTEVQFNDAGSFNGDAGMVYNKTSNVLTISGDIIVAGQSVCQEDGTNCPSGGAPAFSTVTAGTNTAALVVGTGGTLGVSGTGTITPNYTPSGSIAATTVQGAIAELDSEKQPLDGDLTAIAALSTNGIAARTGVNTWVIRDASLSPCSAGAAPRGLNTDLTPFGCATYQPLDADLTTYAGITPSANTQTLLGGADFAAWRTSLSLVPGTNVQVFDTQLTEIAALTPTDNKIFGSNGSVVLYYTTTDCTSGPVTYNQTTHTFACGTYPAGTVSGTTGNAAKFTGSNAVGDNAFQTVDVDGNILTGQTRLGTTGTNDITPDFTAVTGNKTWTVQNLSGTIPIQSGALTDGHAIIANASGQLIDGGSGVVTASSADIFTNKTLNAESAGNVITVPEKKWFEVAACQAAVASLIWNSPAANAPAATCDVADPVMATADFDASTDESIEISYRLPSDWTGAIDVSFIWKAAATAGAVGWCLQTARTPDAAVSSTTFAAQGAGNCVSDTAKGTTLQENVATITGVTCTSCAAGDRLKLRVSRDANGGAVTDDMTGDAKLIGVELTIRRAM